MSRYFFHIHDGVSIPDTEGTELDSVDDVLKQSIEFAGKTLVDLGQAFWNSEKWQLEVVDQAGEQVLTLEFEGRLGTRFQN